MYFRVWLYKELSVCVCVCVYSLGGRGTFSTSLEVTQVLMADEFPMALVRFSQPELRVFAKSFSRKLHSKV